MNEATSNSVLLMAYGSPESVDQMAPYLKNVMKGRPASPAMVREFQERYRSFGGCSPLLQISRRQAEALEKKLGIPVRVGMRYWHPYIADVVGGLQGRIIGLCLAPQHSKASVAGYLKAFRAAASGPVTEIPYWHRQPKFLAAWADRIRAGLEQHRPEVLLFTAHSVPEDAEDPYPGHLQETIDGILPDIPAIPWHFAYQSASSAPLKWLGPDVDQKLGELAAAGVTRVMAAPISFVSDHAEVLFDLDQLHKESAEKMGITLTRCASLNDHPLLIQALADTVCEVL